MSGSQLDAWEQIRMGIQLWLRGHREPVYGEVELRECNRVWGDGCNEWSDGDMAR